MWHAIRAQVCHHLFWKYLLSSFIIFFSSFYLISILLCVARIVYTHFIVYSLWYCLADWKQNWNKKKLNPKVTFDINKASTLHRHRHMHMHRRFKWNLIWAKSKLLAKPNNPMRLNCITLFAPGAHLTMCV